MSNEQPKGRISREYTVWCGGCVEWQQEGAAKMAHAASTFRSSGWKLTKKRGWLCPICAEHGPRNEQEAAHE